MKDNNYINDAAIKDAMAAGKTEEDIAKMIANSVSNAFIEGRKEKIAREEKEKESAAKKEKLSHLRNKLIDIVIEYLVALGYEIKGDLRTMLDKKFKTIETRDYPYPFLHWDDLLWW